MGDATCANYGYPGCPICDFMRAEGQAQTAREAHQAIAKLKAKLEAAEANLRTAVEALEQIARSNFGDDVLCAVARAALEEIRGRK